MKDRITSKELAKLVGVSSATISRAFSADARISAQTRARVLAMAQQYGYQPNAIARTLNNRQSDLVAVVVNAIVNPCEAQQLEMLVHQLQARRSGSDYSLLRGYYRPFAVDASRFNLPG